MIEKILENKFPFPNIKEIENELEKGSIKIGNLIWSKANLKAIIPRGEILKDGENVFYDFDALCGIEEFLGKENSKWKIPNVEDFMYLERCLENNTSLIKLLNKQDRMYYSIWWSNPVCYNAYMNCIYVMRINFYENRVFHPERVSALKSFNIRLVKEVENEKSFNT